MSEEAFGGRRNLTTKGKIIPNFFSCPENLIKAKECTSAPTEILTEFLFSIMTKNYEKALKYCTQILNYEPYNMTAREFYPLIVGKLEMKLESSSSESSDSYSSESSESSTDNSSQNKVLKMKSLKESIESYRSPEDEAIEGISDFLGSNFMTSNMETKNKQSATTNDKIPLKEKN